MVRLLQISLKKTKSHLIINFKDVIFLSFEQTKDKKIAQFLSIDYWTTIVVYKDNKEISRTIGQTDKDKLYSQIRSTQ